MTNKARISCDTRWQPSSDFLDPRFNGETIMAHGDTKFGLNAMSNTPIEDEITIEKLIQNWKILNHK